MRAKLGDVCGSQREVWFQILTYFHFAGHGTYDWSSGVFDVTCKPPVDSASDSSVPNRSFNLGFMSKTSHGMAFRVSVALQSKHFELEVNRIFNLRDRTNITAVRTRHDSTYDFWSWDVLIPEIGQNGTHVLVVAMSARIWTALDSMVGLDSDNLETLF